MSLGSLFSSSNFERTIRKYCSANGWKIADLNSRRAILKFSMNSGRNQTLYIIRFESRLEFAVHSMAAFDSEEDVPHILSTMLLKRSAQLKIGFWCIEEIGGKQVYSCMHNAEMELLNSDFFANVVTALIKECDDFEDVIKQIVEG